MSVFEYIVALYVVLAGLGLTLLVRSVGQIIEARARVQLYWVHTIWLGIIFLAHVGSWFILWSFQHVPRWTPGGFLLLLSVPTVLYLVSHVSVPEIPEDESTHDMRSYFYERYRMILGLLAAFVVLNMANELLLVGHLAPSTVSAFRATILVLLAVGMSTASPRVHALVAATIGVVALLAFSLLNTALQ